VSDRRRSTTPYFLLWSLLNEHESPEQSGTSYSPSSSTVVSGVMSPDSRPATALKGLKVDPGAY
jgi:hypothetical protein